MNTARHAIVEQILRGRIVAILRAEPAAALPHVVEALLDGGITAAEIPLTVPGAIDALRETHRRLGDRVALGAGSVTGLCQLHSIIDAGCRFAVSPHTDVSLISAANRLGCPLLAGALSPTEAVLAWEAGSPIVKVFPADFGGPKMLADFRGPLPQIELLPTGGITLQNAVAHLRAGASALGVGSSLVPKALIHTCDWNQITNMATEFRRRVETA